MAWNSFPPRQTTSCRLAATGRLARLAVAATILPVLSGIGRAQTNVTFDATSGSSTIAASYTTSGGLTISLGFFGDYLVVGGGGASGGGYPGGGGGGEVLSGSGTQITSATNTVVVGRGGTYTGGTNVFGASSSFLAATASGGGGGGTNNGGTSGSGFTGGNRIAQYAGGGGGQTARGGNGNASTVSGSFGGAGGVGLNSTITGSTLMYGFGGSGNAPNTGPSAKNGDGTITNPRANSGGGGRRISGTTPGNAGSGNGADGIVILRYAGSDATGVTGGTAATGTGSAAGFMLQQFTVTGTTTLAIDFDTRLGATLTGTISGGSDGVTFNGPGRLTLVAENTYTGATTVSAGTLVIGNGGTTGSVAGDLVTNAATVFNRSDSVSYGGVISGTGSVTKQGAGLLTFAGANSFSGLTTISAGTLALSGAGSIGTGGLNLGTIGSPGVFDLAALTAGTYSLPAIGNLNGVGTLTGNGKSLSVLGSFLPGSSPGTVTLGSGFTLDLSQSGTSVFEITSPSYTAGTFDLVNGDGSVVFGGILSLAFSGGTYAEGTNVLQLFANTGGLSGNFSAVNATGLAAGQSASFDATSGFVTISSVPEPSTYCMALAGLASGGYSMFRRRKRVRYAPANGIPPRGEQVTITGLLPAVFYGQSH